MPAFPLVLAHGVGARGDLPIPLQWAQYGSAFVLVVTFVLLGIRWRRPRFATSSGRALPGLQRIVDSRWWHVVWATVGLLFFFAFVAVAAFGEPESALNAAPTWLYVWLWVGLIPLSMLFGPVWRYLNPSRTLSSGVRALLRRPASSMIYPPRLGYWPAVTGLLIYAWLELAMPNRDRPRILLVFVLVYAVMQVAGGARFGPTWHERGDTFEVYSSVLGHLSPFRRDESGALVFGNPFAHLLRTPINRSGTAFLYVLLGSTAFDGLSRTQLWIGQTRNLHGNVLEFTNTIGLISAIVLIGATFRFACSLTSQSMRDGLPNRTDDVAIAFARSLIPVIVGYGIAHYFSLIVFQGQAGYLLASDPFATGRDLFGFGVPTIDYTVVTPTMIGVVQVGAILLGHIGGVVSAHDRALEVLNEEDARVGQYPLMACMILYTIVGIGLLLGA